jgi:hypothetical protein
MFKRTAGVSCSLKESIDGLEIIVCDKMFHCTIVFGKTSNGNTSLGYLKRNLQISNPEVKSRAYQALVRPKLEYSCSIWDPYTHVNINTLEMVQRRALYVSFCVVICLNV